MKEKYSSRNYLKSNSGEYFTEKIEWIKITVDSENWWPRNRENEYL